MCIRDSQVVVLAPPADRRVRVTTGQDRVRDEAHATVASTTLGSVIVTSCTSPVIARRAQAVAWPGTGTATVRPVFEIAPLVVLTLGSPLGEADAWDATHTSTSPGSTIRVMRRSLNANRVLGTSKVTRRDSPGSRSRRT